MSSKRFPERIKDAVRSIIFGAEDGIVSTWGLVVGVSAATHDSSLVILAGLAAAIPGAFSMAAGDYLGSKSKRELQERGVRDARAHISRRKKSILARLHKQYRAEGFTDREVTPWLRRLSMNKTLLLRKYEEEYGLVPESFDNPLLNAFVMFSFFILGALIPLFPFFLFSVSLAPFVSFGSAVLGLFAVGSLKTRITGRSWWRSGLEMLIVGFTAALVGYLIGLLFA